MRKKMFSIMLFFVLLFYTSIYIMAVENNNMIEVYSRDLRTGLAGYCEMDISQITPKSSYRGDSPQDFIGIQDANITPFTIIGNRNWTAVKYPAAAPYRAIGLLQTKFPDNTVTFTTAFMIDRDRGATAAHCIYDPTRGGLATSVIFFPGYIYGQYTYGGYASIRATVMPNYLSGSTLQQGYDVAIFDFSDELCPGDTVGWISISGNAPAKGNYVHAIGYPNGNNPATFMHDGKGQTHSAPGSGECPSEIVDED